MTTERKLRWAAHLFIWSAAIVVLYGALDEFDHWSHVHPARPLVETIAYFIGWMTAGLVKRSGLYILLLINGLVLRRYKSRIAAALFVLMGLSGFGLGTYDLILGAPRSFFLAVTTFFGLYLAIALWTLVTLMRLHGKWSAPVFLGRFASLLQSDKLELEKRTEAYSSLITKVVSQLPLNDRASREKVYDRARAILAEQQSSEREWRALDEAIHRVERRFPKVTVGNPLHRATTASLVVSILFPGASWGWILDFTCMSLYWVARIRV